MDFLTKAMIFIVVLSIVGIIEDIRTDKRFLQWLPDDSLFILSVFFLGLLFRVNMLVSGIVASIVLGMLLLIHSKRRALVLSDYGNFPETHKRFEAKDATREAAYSRSQLHFRKQAPLSLIRAVVIVGAGCSLLFISK